MAHLLHGPSSVVTLLPVDLHGLDTADVALPVVQELLRAPDSNNQPPIAHTVSKA